MFLSRPKAGWDLRLSMGVEAYTLPQILTEISTFGHNHYRPHISLKFCLKAALLATSTKYFPQMLSQISTFGHKHYKLPPMVSLHLRQGSMAGWEASRWRGPFIVINVCTSYNTHSTDQNVFSIKLQVGTKLDCIDRHYKKQYAVMGFSTDWHYQFKFI